jgi:hypothetical protein
MRFSLRSLLAPALGAVLVMAPTIARGQISVLSSTVEEHEAAKGETYSGRIVISNTSNAPQAVRIYQTDYHFKSDGTSDYSDPGTTSRSNATWVTPQTQRVVVPPRTEVTVPYSVKVPTSDSLTGTYWSMIMVEAAESAPAASSGSRPQLGIGAIIRYAVQVATHIGSTGKRAVTFDKPAASHMPNGDAALDVDVTSSGDRAVRPTLSVELYDAQGALKGKGKQVRGLLYPGTSLRQHFEFGSLPAGTYRVIVFADTGDPKVLAAQYTVTY